MESPREILRDIDVHGIEDEKERQAAFARLEAKKAIVGDYVDHILQKSGRMQFTFQELQASYDGTFAELIDGILFAGEEKRESSDWDIEDVIWAGCQALAARVGLDISEDPDPLPENNSVDDFKYDRLP